MAKIILSEDTSSHGEKLVGSEFHKHLTSLGYKLHSGDTYPQYGKHYGTVTYTHPGGHSVEFSRDEENGGHHAQVTSSFRDKSGKETHSGEDLADAQSVLSQLHQK